uniref:DDE_Tnp_1-associated n=1 Tax=Candidatus Kentrum sp. TUN TaxID=2126343 RepID=A0A451A881_9GAMM|nr:MAG: DDE_Tnp_1-associated [Candidatus Kentron sp. TUN]
MSSDPISCFRDVKDPRSDKNKLYPLPEILLLCIFAVVSGADGWKSIAEFGRAKLGWLRKFLFLVPARACVGMYVFPRMGSHAGAGRNERCHRPAHQNHRPTGKHR